MTTEMKQRLFDRLTRNLDKMCNGDALMKKLFEQFALEDIEAIEPLIDIFIVEAKIEAPKEAQAAIAAKLAPKGENHGTISDHQAGT
jgi:hypothetical protein